MVSGRRCRARRACRYGALVAILRETDPRIGCLAIPISAVAGFIVTALVAAAIGFGASEASVAGLVGAAGAVMAAVLTLRRTAADHH
jgi:hypothetical protein